MGSSNISYLDAISIWFEIDIEELNDTRQTLIDNLPVWEGYFIENLSMLSGFDITPPNKGKDQKYGIKDSNKYQLSYLDEGAFIKIESHVILSLYAPLHLDGCNLYQLETALNTTNKKKRPILEYYLLMYSLKALKNDEYRRSILDAATALEICLTNLLNEHVFGDQTFKNEIIKAYNSISKKRKLLRVLNIELPELDYQKDLEEVRNKVIHRAYEPLQGEANKAYNITKETLDTIVKDKFEEFIS